MTTFEVRARTGMTSAPLFRICGLTMAAVVTLAACAGPASDGGPNGGSLEDMEPMTLSFTSTMPESHSLGIAQKAFAEHLDEQTDGKITVNQYFNGSLMPGQEVLTGVSAGTADVGFAAASHFPQELPISNWVDNMGAMQGFAMPTGHITGAAAMNDIYNTPGPVQDEWEAQGVKVLTAANSPSYKLFCNKPVTSAADARGLRTRVGGGVWLPEVEAMGMEPISISLGEVYEALQRGVVDCVTLDTVTAESVGLWEVAKHLIPVNMSASTSLVLVMGLDQWESLSEEVQEVVTGAAETYWLEFMELHLQEIGEFQDKVEEHDMEIHDPSALNELLAAHQDKRESQLRKSAPTSLENPEKLISSYESLIDKWHGILTDDMGLEVPVTDAERPDFAEEYTRAGDFPFDEFREQFRAHAE